MIFRIHRMKDTAQEHFRWSAHTSGSAITKPKDYEVAGEVSASNTYAAWSDLRQTDHPLRPGDLLEDESGNLHIYKYIGFERATWWVPEPKVAPAGAAETQAENTESAGTEVLSVNQ